MTSSSSGIGTILITGGTSGLGRELAIKFLRLGYLVVVTGRRFCEIPGYKERVKFFCADFSDLGKTRDIFHKICKDYRFDIVVNNAGILSPGKFTLTPDGPEYTLQVNFLAHLLINEIILKHHNSSCPIIIVSITSPVYKLAGRHISFHSEKEKYVSFRSYSQSKLYLALTGRYLVAKYPEIKLTCISFDPGVFSSGIYRTRSPLFRSAYRIASPFMRSPARVAEALTGLLQSGELQNGTVYTLKGSKKQLPEVDLHSEELFWEECSKFLGKYVER